MKISLIAALDRNRVIGSDAGGLPWSLPRDKAHFRSYTEGHWLLIGRTTYEEMGGWFTTQRPIILTTDESYEPQEPTHRIAGSALAAIDIAKKYGAAELVVGGGGAVFAELINLANRLVLTQVDTAVAIENPVYFPDYISCSDWAPRSRESWPADSENEYAMRLEIWEKSL